MRVPKTRHETRTAAPAARARREVAARERLGVGPQAALIDADRTPRVKKNAVENGPRALAASWGRGPTTN